MKQTRLVLALLVSSLAATPTLAASLTMLQFGSFETRDEAEKKLADINGKYKDALGTLATSIREVKLPPDNLTVYRTQAGPVADRAAAQSICSKLAATGDECYIVQTAMVTTPPATTAVAAAAPAPAPAAAPAPVAVTTPATELTKAKDQVLASTTGPTPDVTSKLSLMQPTTTDTVDTRDPTNRAALARVNTPLTENSALPVAPETPSADQSAEMKAALDKAVVDQPKVANDISTNVAEAQPTSRGSFWSRLNPFSSTPKPEVAPVVVAKTPDTAAPVETVAAQSLEAPVVAAAPLPETKPEVKPEVQVAAATPVVTTPVVTKSTTVLPAPAASAAITTVATPNVGFSNAPVITQAPVMQLPPPPAPLKAQDRAELAAGKTPLPAPEPVAAPINIAPLPPVASAPGNVQVEEAKRVPVTINAPLPTQAPFPTPKGPVGSMTPFVQAPVPLQPSATDSLKTIWAQIGPFTGNEEALSYWANYRQNHPDFPVVRVRVASNYQTLLRGGNAYYLRVGPMAQKAFVSSLCKSLSEVADGQPEPPKKQCGIVSDVGGSSPLGTPTGVLPKSRYNGRH